MRGCDRRCCRTGRASSARAGRCPRYRIRSAALDLTNASGTDRRVRVHALPVLTLHPRWISWVARPRPQMCTSRRTRGDSSTPRRRARVRGIRSQLLRSGQLSCQFTDQVCSGFPFGQRFRISWIAARHALNSVPSLAFPLQSDGIGFCQPRAVRTLVRTCFVFHWVSVRRKVKTGSMSSPGGRSGPEVCLDHPAPRHAVIFTIYREDAVYSNQESFTI